MAKKIKNQAEEITSPETPAETTPNEVVSDPTPAVETNPTPEVQEAPAPEAAPEVPQTAVAVAERPSFRLERKLENYLPEATKFPSIRGGICEFCGVIDSKVPSWQQWTLCKHYSGLKEIKCSYCPPGS